MRLIQLRYTRLNKVLHLISSNLKFYLIIEYIYTFILNDKYVLRRANLSVDMLLQQTFH